MKKSIVVFLITLIVCVCGCSSKLSFDQGHEGGDPIKIAVSIVPQKTFVQAVGGDKVEVVTMIPTGYSPANYEPTPLEMAKFDEAKIYFSVGVATEISNILPMVEKREATIKVIALADKVGDVYKDLYLEAHSHEDDHDEDGHDEEEDLTRDPHIWLSPKRVVVMVASIRDELVLLDPENKIFYEKNASKYIEELIAVDEMLSKVFDGLENKEIIMYHPSFGYFAEDYGLQMTTIEEDGKEATVKRISQVVDYARLHHIKVIFYQEEFDSKQAQVIANEIEGTVIKVAPLSGDYINNLKDMAEKFNQVFSE